MQYQEIHKYQLVQSFLNLIRNTQSKQEFLNRVQEFDNRFTEDQNTHTFSEKHKSVEKLPPVPPEKPKNPFKNNYDDNLRHHTQFNNNQTAQNFNQNTHHQPTNLPKAPYARTEQNFYKAPTNPGIKAEYINQGNQNYSYGGLNNPTPKSNSQHNYNHNGSSGMGVINYNAYSQRQYDDLKEQFFRPPNLVPNDHYSKIQESYNMRNNDNSFNMHQIGGGHLGMSSSSELLAGPQISTKNTNRGYPQRMNPFQRQ